MKQPTQQDVVERTATPPVKKEYTPQMFVEMYQKLCSETGFTIGSHPEFKFRDDGTFSVVVVQTVEKLSQAN